MNPRSPVAPARPPVRRRGREAHELLVAGVPNEEIVRRLGYSSARAMLRAATSHRQENALLLDEQTGRVGLDTYRARLELLFAGFLGRVDEEGTRALMGALRVLKEGRALNGYHADYVLLSSILPVLAEDEPEEDEPVEDEPEASLHEMPVRKDPPATPAPPTTALRSE